MKDAGFYKQEGLDTNLVDISSSSTMAQAQVSGDVQISTAPLTVVIYGGIMKSKLIHEGEQKTYALIFEKEDEVVRELTRFAKQQKLNASHFTAIGAFRSAVLGFFEREKKDYKKIPVNEQEEVLSLIGDITLAGEEPKLHAHAVLGKADGATCGGHLLEARVWPTLEVVLTESPRHLRRKLDDETGLPLIELSAGESL